MKRIIFLILIAFVLAEFCYATTDTHNVIEVYGESREEVYADTWDICFSVTVREKTQSLANNRYNAAVDLVRKLLATADIPKDKITTESISSNEWYEYTKSSYVLKGWEMEHLFKIHLENAADAGKALSKLSAAPNTSIYAIDYGLKKETRDKALIGLYTAAYKQAAQKIDILLNAMNKTLDGIRYAGENLEGGQPIEANYELKRLKEKEATIILSPKKMLLSVTLRVVASYK